LNPWGIAIEANPGLMMLPKESVGERTCDSSSIEKTSISSGAGPTQSQVPGSCMHNCGMYIPDLNDRDCANCDFRCRYMAMVKVNGRLHDQINKLNKIIIKQDKEKGAGK
jgi:hypothetical protein